MDSVLGTLVKIFLDGSGSMTFQPIGFIPNIFHAALWLGLILGAINGLLSGILVGFFKLGEFKGALAGFLIGQAFILLWTILHYDDYFDFYRPSFSFEKFVANIIVFIMGWLFATGFLLIESTLTGYLTAKIYRICTSNYNLKY